MEAITGIIVIIALISGVMTYSASDIDNEAELFWCFGLCMELQHKLKADGAQESEDPNNPTQQEIVDEIRDIVHDDAIGRKCGSAANPVC